jgi:hypothetical protein
LRKETGEVKSQEIEERNASSLGTGDSGKSRVKSSDRSLRKESGKVKGQEFEERHGQRMKSRDRRWRKEKVKSRED